MGCVSCEHSKEDPAGSLWCRPGALDLRAQLLRCWVNVRLAPWVAFAVVSGAVSVSGAGWRSFGLTVALLCSIVFLPSVAVQGLCSFLHVTRRTIPAPPAVAHLHVNAEFAAATGVVFNILFMENAIRCHSTTHAKAYALQGRSLPPL